ncbi:MAG TPA: pyrimidine dimer DNA glycosylase/endonuclease V, partial [Flavobacteriaceae bacterium]|nr:pyrimidine dimer DNA glycosylase/endonuclease V [Flavobacteriaceae bacterium]
MRIWSLHPKYLDTKGLVALWRETLLAKHVLEGKTKGYKNHPQLNRFKALNRSVDAINQYLSLVYDEAVKRGYNFNKEKINWDYSAQQLQVTNGQIEYEFKHLLNKLKIRDLEKFKTLSELTIIETHPMFDITDGPVESWEVI